MNEHARVLLADDEETFRRSTAELLRQAGLNCDTASDAPTAMQMLRAREYDVLISDIKMPGNGRLQMLESLAQSHASLPVILVTGYPSTDSACRVLDLPVWAYLIKPVDFATLLDKTRTAIHHHQFQEAMVLHEERLSSWCDVLAGSREALSRFTAENSEVTVHTYLSIAINQVAMALSDIHRLVMLGGKASPDVDICRLMACPRLSTLQQAIEEAICDLEKTKSSFKSKELAAVRTNLKRVLADTLKP